MLYKDIYELLVYLKVNSIQLPLDLKEEVLRSSLEPKFFGILKLHPEMIRLFLYPVPTIEKFEFIMSMKCQLPFFKLQKIVNSIDWEERGNDILKVLNLLDSKYVNDWEIMELIISQATWTCMKQLYLALKSPIIANNKEYFKIIAGQDEWEKMEELRLACKIPVVANNKEYFEIIARQDEWKKMEELRLACEIPVVANNKGYFEIIAGQDEWEKMERLCLFLENPVIADNKENFEMLAEQDTWEKMMMLCLAYISQEKVKEISNCVKNVFLRWKCPSDQKVGKLSSQKELLTKLREVNALIEQEDIESLEVLKMGTLADMEYVPSLIREKKGQSIPKKEVRKNEQ